MLSTLKSLSVEGVVLKQLSINGITVWTTPLSYTNWVPTSIDTDGSVYNGCGYKEVLRLNSSGAVKDKTNSVVTGFIPAKGGDVIRIAGVNWAYSSSANYICAYDAAFVHIGAGTSQGSVYSTRIWESMTAEGEMGIIKLTPLDNIAYIRVSSAGDNTKQEKGDKMIVTINEEIV
jgi:hypothetical protein